MISPTVGAHAVATMDRRADHHTTAQLLSIRRVASLGLPAVAGMLALRPLVDHYSPGAALPRLFPGAAGSAIFIAGMSVLEARVERVGRVEPCPRTDD